MQEATHDLVFNELATAYHWKYFAVDQDGKGFVYKIKPELCEHWWSTSPDNCDYIGEFDPQGWRDSLIIRIFEEFDESWLNRDDCPEWANYAFIQDSGLVVVSHQKPYWDTEDHCYYRQIRDQVQLMKNWGVFRITDKYYARPSKKERKLFMEQEATHDLIFNQLATDARWKYFAIDDDGEGFVYEQEPERGAYSWFTDDRNYHYVGHFDPQGWEESLIIRLFKEPEEFDGSWFNRTDCPKWAKYALINYRGMVAVSDQKPSWNQKEQVYYHKDSARVELMENWGKFRINDKKYYTRPSKKKGKTKMCMEKEPKMYTKEEAAGISKNVAVASLKKHIEDGVKKSVETGLRTWLVPTSCFVPKMLDKEDFIQILVNTGYKLEELDNGDFELRWR